jgi:hypothetical protein
MHQAAICLTIGFMLSGPAMIGVGISGAQAASPERGNLLAATTPDTLTAMTGSGAAIPVPQGAEELDIDTQDGTVEFEIDAPVAAVAAFYRAQLASPPWVAQPGVINQPNMVVLNYRRDSRALVITIMAIGGVTTVTAQGEPLKLAQTPMPAPSAAPNQAAPPAAATEVVLERHETGGLPVPRPFTAATHENTRYRKIARATVQAPVGPILAFYRTELRTRGWVEQPDAQVEATRARLSFTSQEGPAVLTLTGKGRDTEVELLIRNEKAARDAGLMPPAGQTKFLVGNMSEKAATITLAGKTYRLRIGEGTQGPDGPKVDLAPGPYKVTVKVGSGAARDEDIVVGPDEIWGLLIGPRGLLPMQLY